MNIMNGIYQTLCILSNRTLTLWKRCRKIPIQACSLFLPPFSSLSEASAMSTNCQHTMHCTLPTANACTTQVPQVVHLDLVSLSLCNPTITFGGQALYLWRRESKVCSRHCITAMRSGPFLCTPVIVFGQIVDTPPRSKQNRVIYSDQILQTLKYSVLWFVYIF